MNHAGHSDPRSLVINPLFTLVLPLVPVPCAPPLAFILVCVVFGPFMSFGCCSYILCVIDAMCESLPCALPRPFFTGSLVFLLLSHTPCPPPYIIAIGDFVLELEAVRTKGHFNSVPAVRDDTEVFSKVRHAHSRESSLTLQPHLNKFMGTRVC